MVTHNPELAKEYATRIVTLKDGVILDDTNPYHVESFVPQHRNMGKTSMSLLTSLSLSFNNLKTKKEELFNIFCRFYRDYRNSSYIIFIKWC